MYRDTFSQRVFQSSRLRIFSPVVLLQHGQILQAVDDLPFDWLRSMRARLSDSIYDAYSVSKNTFDRGLHWPPRPTPSYSGRWKRVELEFETMVASHRTCIRYNSRPSMRGDAYTVGLDRYRVSVPILAFSSTHHTAALSSPIVD